jgi:hypothetical protein
MNPRSVSSLALWAPLALLASGLGGCTCSTEIGSETRDGAISRDVSSPPTAHADECGNGVDDDMNGRIDDGCPCGPGEVQGCFGGALDARGVGACTDGTQTCRATGSTEWGDWGEATCEGDVVTAEERCDGQDHDCDGAVDEGCPCTAGATSACGVEFLAGECRPGTQTCSTEGTWSGCEGAVGPRTEICDNGLDEDCDGAPDDLCGCVPEPELCRDGIDNDCDGAIDEPACDPDWSGDAGTPVPPMCTDGLSVLEVDRYGNMLCMRSSEGTIACAGRGSSTLGDGSTYVSETPIVVPGIATATDLEVGGGGQVCAVLASGEVQCFGGNVYSTPTAPEASTPTTIAGLSDARSVECGTLHCCALLATGQVSCWGYGQYGLGDGVGGVTMATGRAPVIVAGLANVVEIVTGAMHSCARTADDALWCWGLNSYGTTLGDGRDTHANCNTPDRPLDCAYAPVRVTAITGAAVRLRGAHFGTCAVLDTGAIACWGNPTSTATSGMVPHAGLGVVTDAVDVALGQWNVCWQSRAGEVRCLGEDCNCQLGDGMRGGSGGLADCTGVEPFTPAPGTIPVDVGVVRQLSSAPNGSAVLTEGGEVKYWGLLVGSSDSTLWCTDRALEVPWPGC